MARQHPRFKLHFTPTSSSWINLVERLFAGITRQQIRRDVFKSVADLTEIGVGQVAGETCVLLSDLGLIFCRQSILPRIES